MRTTASPISLAPLKLSLPKAPGFCFARTMTVSSQFADASAYSHLEIEYQSKNTYTGFKAAFAADTLIAQFQSFKADFNVSATNGDFAVVRIPFTRSRTSGTRRLASPGRTRPQLPGTCETSRAFRFGRRVCRAHSTSRSRRFVRLTALLSRPARPASTAAQTPRSA